jgi:hypothetical protein
MSALSMLASAQETARAMKCITVLLIAGRAINILR